MADDYLHGAYANQQQSAGSRLSSNRGRPGFSAYEIAVQHGFEGSEEDWLASLVGNGIANTELNDDYTLTLTYTDGTSDTTGSIRGEQGAPGIDANVSGEILYITTVPADTDAVVNALGGE